MIVDFKMGNYNYTLKVSTYYNKRSHRHMYIKDRGLNDQQEKY